MCSHPTHPGREKRRLRTAILLMPFGLVSYPSIGASSMKAVFQQNGYPLDVKYCNFEFISRIGSKAYSSLTLAATALLIPEFVFAKELNPTLGNYTDYIHAVMPWYFKSAVSMKNGIFSQWVEQAVKCVPKYLNDLEENLDLSGYDVIGFSSTFSQNAASWAFAKRLRRRYPKAVIVFGGGNCDGVMGQAQVDAYDFIDYVCVGDGETCFLDLVKWLEDPEHNEFPSSGIVSRERRYAPQANHHVDINQLPIPDYSDYFDQIQKYPEWRDWYAGLLMESSRGCWWGQKSQCVFCGCNGSRIKFRQKPAGFFLSQLRELRSRYGDKCRHVQMCDNIMPYSYFDEFLPLVARERPYETLFYEVKSNLKPEQMRQLRDAGVRNIQPGIESLCTPILKLMRKGVTGIANIQTLKYATEYRIGAVWLILCGFYGETPEQYEAQARLFGKLFHLQPPRRIIEITIDRYSPIHEHPEQYGFNIEPAGAYKYLYQLPDSIIQNLAYWFQDRNRWQRDQKLMDSNNPMLPEYAISCSRVIRIWQHMFWKKKVRFDYEMSGDEIEIVDSRSGTEVKTTFGGLKQAIIGAALKIATFAGICASVRARWPLATDAEIHRALQELVEASYVFDENGSYLFLGLNRRELAGQDLLTCGMYRLHDNEQPSL